jgi:hypothetical protein
MARTGSSFIVRPAIHAAAISIPLGLLYAEGYRGRYRGGVDSLPAGDGIAMIGAIFIFLTLLFTGLQFLGVRISFFPASEKPKELDEKKKKK